MFNDSIDIATWNILRIVFIDLRMEVWLPKHVVVLIDYH
jgi:hypothetical protein